MDWRDITAIAGALLVIAGLWFAWWPLAVMACGILLITISLITAR